MNRISIKLAGGRGGPGAVHFQRTRRTARGGPDGGDGGRGGHLILSPTDKVRDFSHLKPGAVYRAPDGKPGGRARRKGAQGKNRFLPVPKATLCYNAQGELLQKLTQEDWCFAKGGKGGKGNCFFKTSRRQAPQTAQTGQAPPVQKIILSLTKNKQTKDKTN